MKWRMRMGLKTLISAAAPMSIVSPLRRDCGHRPNASQLALSANSDHSPVALSSSVGVAWLDFHSSTRGFGDGSADVH
jgi:hypothetical protein